MVARRSAAIATIAVVALAAGDARVGGRTCVPLRAERLQGRA
jgi:hypothetical protein